MTSGWMLGRFWGSIRDFYNELNPATLTGAVDVIVVEQPNGDLICSPFYVRFGKMGVLRSKEKVVDMTVNDIASPIHMKLSDTGEAFFIESLDGEDEIPCHLATSPLPPSSMELMKRGLENLHAMVDQQQRTTNESTSSEEQFNANHLLTYDRLNTTPDILFNSNDLYIQMNGNESAVNTLINKYQPKSISPPSEPRERTQSVNSDTRENSQLDTRFGQSAATTHEARDTSRKPNPNAGMSSYFWWRRATSADPPPSKSEEINIPNTNGEISKDGDLPMSPFSNPLPLIDTMKSDTNLAMDDRQQSPSDLSSTYEFDDRGWLSDSELEEFRKTTVRARYKKTLKLTSDQLKTLNLRRGVANKVSFSVTTKYQGTTVCDCEIWLWRYDDKVIISDIDGTITKSDVLGQILPRVGAGMWAHIGVAELFTRIAANDYKIVYLSARAIGMATQTKEYLKSVLQDRYNLPGGPLLLSPTSVFNALHREVIEKKPEVFKIQCLRDVAALYPSYINPFYAGFGNRANDTIAYTAAGVPPNKIYIIDPTGRVEFVDKRLEFSYPKIVDLVDHIFPPLRTVLKKQQDLETLCPAAPEEFNSAQYWRSPVPELDVDVTKFPKPTSTSSKTSAKSLTSSTSSIGWTKKK